MGALLKAIAAAGIALAVAWFAVVVGGDTTVAVPPPESIAEQFGRHIAARRYDRALQHVADGSGITLITVRLAGEAFHQRAGAIAQVEGEPGAISGERATAAAVFTTRRAGRVRFAFQLVRSRGVWKIAGWQEQD
jgi:hypothetical protein